MVELGDYGDLCYKSDLGNYRMTSVLRVLFWASKMTWMTCVSNVTWMTKVTLGTWMTWVTRLSLSICVIWVTKVFCASKMI